MEAVARRHVMYNDTLRFIEAQAAAGRLFVLCPDVAPDVGRVERVPEKLRRQHAAGYAAAEQSLDALGRCIGGAGEAPI